MRLVWIHGLSHVRIAMATERTGRSGGMCRVAAAGRAEESSVGRAFMTMGIILGIYKVCGRLRGRGLIKLLACACVSLAINIPATYQI